MAVELSYLSEEEQYELQAVMNMEQCTPSLSQANRLKRLSQSGELDMDAIYLILEEEKPNQKEQIKIRSDRLAPYFPEDYTDRQMIEIIEKLVREWHQEQGKKGKDKEELQWQQEIYFMVSRYDSHLKRISMSGCWKSLRTEN